MSREHIGTATARSVPRIQADADLLARLVSRLTRRDRWLLEMLHEHRVLTLPHITDLAFDSRDTARHRMLMLYRHGAVARFRPVRDVGSAPHHYVLGPAGAAVLSAARDERIGYRAEQVLALAHSAKLAHLVGVNGVFCALSAHARRTPGCSLERWWSERRCEQAWGRLVRPDGYGRWCCGSRSVDFFVEYDTGTEPLPRLLDKVTAYVQVAEQNHAGTGVGVLLFVLPSEVRERHLHALLRPHPTLTVATTFLPDPAGAIWRPVGSDVRRGLAEVEAR